MAIQDGIVSSFTNTFGIEPNNLPLIGSAFTNQNEKDLTRAMEAAAQSYRNIMPSHAAAQQQGLQNQMAAFQPTNSMLSAMGGPGAAIDFNQVFQPMFAEGHPANPATPLQPPPSAAPSGQSSTGDTLKTLAASNPITAPLAWI